MENGFSSKYRNPTDYLKIFFRRKLLFISPIFVGLIIGIIASLTLPPTYESYTLILVQEEKVINPLIQGLAVSTSVAERMQTIKEQLLGWNSLIQLTKKLNLATKVETQKQFEGLILGLRKNILVQIGGPNLIKLTYRGKNPQETQLIAQTLSDILIEENMRSQTKETDVAINFIKEQLDLYKKKIKESEIAEMEEQLQKLLVDSTEQHPLVKELRQKIDAARKEMESGDFKVKTSTTAANNPLYTSLKKEIDKIQNDASALPSADTYASAPDNSTGEPNDPNVAIYKLMLMDKVDSVLARDIQVNENIYNMLLQKLETAKITQRLEASKEGTRYTVIDPPRLPFQPIKPNKPMVIFLGIFLGTAAGTGLVLGREFIDRSFLDIDDARQTLKFPVLGAISRLTTEEEIAREKQKKRIFISSGIILGAILVVTALLFNLLKR